MERDRLAAIGEAYLTLRDINLTIATAEEDLRYKGRGHGVEPWMRTRRVEATKALDAAVFAYLDQRES